MVKDYRDDKRTLTDCINCGAGPWIKPTKYYHFASDTLCVITLSILSRDIGYHDVV